jgi:hypothetical protein
MRIKKEVNYMKKVLPIMVIGIFVLSGLGAGANSFDEILDVKYAEIENINSYLDELDQSQINTSLVSEGITMPVGCLTFEKNVNFQIAQSFIPDREVITKVELYIGKNTTASYPYVVAIRDNLTGENLREISVGPGGIVPLNYSWIEFDFDDMWVDVGNTYFIVSYSENVTDNFYAWGAHNDSESYPYGCAWMSIDDGDTWTNESTSMEKYNKQIGTARPVLLNDITWDMCFKTYGRDNAAPEPPTIEGPTSGKAGEKYDYNFSTIDSEEDEVYFWIVWFEGCPGVNWVGPYTSGEKVTFNNSWEKRGKYTISVKAKDSHGAESNWSTLEVTMPKNKKYNMAPLFQLFLDKHPNMILLLRQMLGKYH